MAHHPLSLVRQGPDPRRRRREARRLGRRHHHGRQRWNEPKVPSCEARWKTENEGFNVLQFNGYHLEHTPGSSSGVGHGKQNLAMMFATLNLLASAIHTACDCLERICVEARTVQRARRRFFEHIRTITAYFVFPDRRTLMETLIASKPPPDIEAQTAR